MCLKTLLIVFLVDNQQLEAVATFEKWQWLCLLTSRFGGGAVQTKL